MNKHYDFCHKNTKNINKSYSESPFTKILLFSIILGFVASFILCVLFVEKADVLWVNIIGFPLQILGGTMVLSLILFCIFSILFLIFAEMIDFIKILPKQNFHILGYITFLYMIFTLLGMLFLNLNYIFYEILRYFVTSFSIWVAVRIKQNYPQNIMILIFSIIAVIYNPIAKLSFNKEFWIIADIIVLVTFMGYFFMCEIDKKKD